MFASRFWPIAVLAIGLPTAARCQQTADSIRLGALRTRATSVVIEAPDVSFTVRGAASGEVTAALHGTPKRQSPSGALVLSAVGDTVHLRLARQLDAPYQLAVTVPVGSALRLIGDNGGQVDVSGVGGPVEITHSNGGVRVDGAVGYALVATSNGDVRVALARVSDVPMSIITSNGDIELRVPATFKATLVVDASVALTSEFPLQRADRSPGGTPLLRRFLVGGGGPTVRLYTDNGSVRLRKAEPARPL